MGLARRAEGDGKKRGAWSERTPWRVLACHSSWAGELDALALVAAHRVHVLRAGASASLAQDPTGRSGQKAAKGPAAGVCVPGVGGGVCAQAKGREQQGRDNGGQRARAGPGDRCASWRLPPSDLMAGLTTEATICDEYFVESIKVVVETYGIPDDVAGAPAPRAPRVLRIFSVFYAPLLSAVPNRSSCP